MSYIPAIARGCCNHALITINAARENAIEMRGFDRGFTAFGEMNLASSRKKSRDTLLFWRSLNAKEIATEKGNGNGNGRQTADKRRVTFGGRKRHAPKFLVFLDLSYNIINHCIVFLTFYTVDVVYCLDLEIRESS